MHKERTRRKPKEYRRESRIPVRATEGEVAELQAAADDVGTPLSSFVRQAALEKARRRRRAEKSVA